MSLNLRGLTGDVPGLWVVSERLESLGEGW